MAVSRGLTILCVGLYLAKCAFQFIVSQLMFYCQNLHTALFTICNLYLKSMNSGMNSTSYPGASQAAKDHGKASKMLRHMGRLFMTPCTATTAENPKKRLGTRQV